MSTTTVTPVVAVKAEQERESKVKLSEVKTTIEDGKESVVIISKATEQLINLAFELQKDQQDSFENASTFQRYMLYQAAVKELKYGCAQAIGRWKNLVNKMAASPAYKGTKNHDEVELIAKGHPKCQTFYKAMQQAVKIQKQLEAVSL